MSRPPLDLGTYGKITTTPTATGYVAKARFRDYDGRTRLVERSSPKSRADAERRLKRALADRSMPTEGDLSGESRVKALAAVWWDDFTEKDRAPATVRRYREVLDSYLLPPLGDLRLREARVGLLDRTLAAIAEKHGAATAKLCQTVLRQMFALAARREALDRNPMRDVAPVQVAQKDVAALSVEQVKDLRSKLEGDMLDALDLLLATGARLGELLALRWEDVDLEVEPARVSITGTVVRGPGGLVRQDRPKSAGSVHRLAIPSFGAEALRRRERWAPYVFPSARGGLWEQTNFRKAWRKAMRSTGYPDVNPHMIRATVGTHLARAAGVSAASAQLGHSSETITVKHYIERLQDAPDMSAALSAFADSNG
ncbi:tyrosine-type recombinase/integrase [Kocuria palustris]|uniref:tyrosine-type recombinase/integrase n=1 Tax=Kocuria palustris TaxID=71999 RepID=UPI0006AA5666|nr:site-specific integrase [Kocuria palustris]ALB03005.1 hypothetical protein KPaMU14_04915 [Kocuria palustris]